MIARRAALAGALAAPAVAARAQGAPARIGWLTAQRADSLAPFIPSLRAGLAELGLAEGRDIRLDFRFGDDDAGRVPALLDELLRLPVRMLLVQGAAAATVIRARPPVPVVFAMSSDPVAAGLAQSLSRPPAGVTGVTFLSAELNAKRIEFLRELNPDLAHVAVLGNPGHPGEALERAEVAASAKRLSLDARFHHARNAVEVQAALAAIEASGAQALSVFADGLALGHRAVMADFAIARRIPMISGWRAFAEAGALISYGPRLEDSYRRLAHFVARILRGARAEDLPIEQPSSFELVLNMRTASAIGVSMPAPLLARADLTIE